MPSISQRSEGHPKNVAVPDCGPSEGDYLGRSSWNCRHVTREKIGGVLLEIRKAWKSAACVEKIGCPLTRFCQWQITLNVYRGPNPAADLKFFLGKQPSKRARRRWPPSAATARQ